MLCHILFVRFNFILLACHVLMLSVMLCLTVDIVSCIIQGSILLLVFLFLQMKFGKSQYVFFFRSLLELQIYAYYLSVVIKEK